MDVGSDQTTGVDYTKRLQRLEGSWIKSILKPVNPYRWNIRKLATGRVLDIGCGIGRNLRYLKRDDALGVDHNEASVQVVKNLGFSALTVGEFELVASSFSEAFDTVLISHVLEHLSLDEAAKLIEAYLPALKVGGRVVAICPQQKGYESDESHKTYFSIEKLEDLLTKNQLTKIRSFSFPLPRVFGKFFIYNENIVVFTKQVITT